MENMFYGATNFDQNIKIWAPSDDLGTTPATGLDNMFNGATAMSGTYSGDGDYNNTPNRAFFNSGGFAPTSKNNLVAAIAMWIDETINANSSVSAGQGSGNYGYIGNWDVSAVTDMSELFKNGSSSGTTTSFNDFIGNWDVSNVTTMNSMFSDAAAFNQPIGNWNVSQVTDMRHMFQGAVAFNQDIGQWNVSQVTSMYWMFYGATAFNQSIGNWNVSQVTDMNYMFGGATAFNQDIGQWNVSSVTDMYQMFYDATAFNQDISQWNVSAVQDMDYMFYNADAFNQDIGQWNVSQVTTMESMFRNTAAFNQDIGCWNVSQVTSMHSMFSGAAAFNQDIRLWYPPDTLTRTNMFNGATAMINHYGAGGVSDDTDFDDGNNNGTPNRNFFDYQVKFGSNKTSSVTVTPNENQDTVGNASATHKYSGNLSYSKSGTDTDDFNIDNTTGALTFATTPDYETKSTYTVIVTATDTDGNSATQTITVNVQNLNDNTPQITSSAIFNNIQENQTTIGQVDANDADGNLNTLTYSVSGDELAISSSGELTFVTAPDYETKSTYTATVTVSDGTNSTTQDITVNVTNVNEAPTFTSPEIPPLSAKVGVFYSFTVATNDVDQGDTVTVAAAIPTASQSWLSFNSTTNEFSGTPNNDDIGQHIVELTATDSNSATGTQTLTITVDGFQPQTRQQLIDAIGLWIDGSITADTLVPSGQGYGKYGEMNTWDVRGPSGSRITDMNSLFQNKTTFNEDISNWNVSNVTDMSYMFDVAPAFNQNISGWNVSNVTTMRCMFCDATTFNQDLSGWERSTSGNTSTLGNVENMRSMFYGATNFNNGDSGNNQANTLNNWNVSSVTTMRTMFYNTAFNQDISGWDVSQVTNMVLMFYNTPFNQAIGQWNVSSVTTMSSMFEKASAFNKDISGWERTGSTVGNVTDMSFMFYSSAFNQPIGNWNVSSVTTMKGMFSTTTNGPSVPFNQDISGWERTGSTVGNVNDMSFMFYKSAFNQPIGNWNVSNVNTMESTFSNAGAFNQDLSGWERSTSGNTSTLANVTNMTQMFFVNSFNNGDSGDNGLKPLNNWNVSGVMFMDYMFYDSPFNQDIEEWNVSNVSSMTLMFANARKFNKPLAKWERQLGVNGATSTSTVGNVTRMEYMFSGAEAFNQDITGWNVSNVTNMSNMFAYAEKFNEDIRTWTPMANVDLTNMFVDATAMIASYSTNPKFGNAENNYTPLVTFFTNVTPVFTSSPTFSALENQKSIGTVTATDGDNDTLTYFVDGNELEINLTSGLLTFKNAPDYETKNTYTATITVSDGTNIVTQDITVNVTDGNERPVITSSATFNTNDKETVIGQVIASDQDTGATLTYSVSGADANTSRTYYIQIDSSTGELTFNSAPDSSNPSSVANTNTYIATVKVSDGTLDTTQDITVNVIDLTDPVIDSSSLVSSINDGSTALGTVSANESVTWSVNNNAIQVDTNGIVTLKTPADYQTTPSYTYTIIAKDNADNTSSVEKTVQVKDTTDPTINSSGLLSTIKDGDTALGTVTANETVIWSIDNNDIQISGNGKNGIVSLRQSANYQTTSSYTYTITAEDGSGNKSITSKTVEVKSVPVVTTTPDTIARFGYKYTYNFSVYNADGGSVTADYSGPYWLSLRNRTAATTTNFVLSGIPNESDAGNSNVVLTITAGNITTTKSFTIIVTKNNPPVFTSAPITEARQESLYSYKVTTSDANDDNITVSATTKPDWLSFNPTTNILSGTPDKNYWGETDIVLTATDGYVNVNQEFKIMVRKPICFNQGTKILCFKNGKEQYIAVEKLKEGDQVKTLKHGYKEIIDMRKGTFKLNGLMDMGMYRMKKQGNMIADLEMSGLHAVLVDKDDPKYADDIKRQRGLNNKKFFIDGKFRLRARESHEFQQMEQKEYTIYSFALEEQQQQYGIWANGLLVETTRLKNLKISNMEKITDLVKGKNQ